MSIENALRRNVSKAETPFNRGDRLILDSPEQAPLTEKWVLPYQDQILEDVTEIRRQVDRTLGKNTNVKRRMRIWDKRYPDGLCGEIRNEVLSTIKREMMNPNKQGMKSLKNFVRAGGVIKPFWGIDSDKYFQNAIQIGTSILDVANDTVDRTKEPIIFYPDIKETPIKSIDSFEQFADVCEEYWDTDIYPNIYLPWFAPVFPILKITPPERDLDGSESLTFETDVVNLFYPNIYTLRNEHLFGLSEDFLTKSKYAQKRLPPEMLEKLLNGSGLLKKLHHNRPDIFELNTDPERALDRIREFHWDRNNSNYDHELLLKYKKEGDHIIRIGGNMEGTNLASINRRAPKKY